jgi:3-oxoacyl-[acyl-carrier-protein] synthase-1
MSVYSKGGLQLAVTGHYAISPVGLDAEGTCAALRAGISRVRESDLYLPMPTGPEATEDVPLLAAMVRDLETDIDGRDRLVALALGALRGLIDRAQVARSELPRTGLLVALPAPDTATSSWNLGQTFMPSLLARAGLSELASPHLAVDQSGNTGVLSLIGRAASLLESGTTDQCIVLGVDSYIDLDRLHALDVAYRLKSQRGLDGFIPGEASVALLLERIAPRVPTRRPSTARLTCPRLASEPRPLTGDRASTGAGLATALRGALRDLQEPGPSGWVLCDLNGESYRAFEWGLVRVRLAAQLAERIVLQHPADSIGDTGAACGGLLIACATQAFVRKYARERAALVWTASDGGSRGALLVYPPLPPAGSS